MGRYHKQIDPIPSTNESGGTDYAMEWCEGICYTSDVEGMYLKQCPECRVTIEEGLVCAKDEY